jgi:hypothetical protein
MSAVIDDGAFRAVRVADALTDPERRLLLSIDRDPPVVGIGTWFRLYALGCLDNLFEITSTGLAVRAILTEVRPS